MSNVVPFCRTEGSNVLFEAVERDFPKKKYRFSAHRDESDEGVYLSFLEPPDARGLSMVRDDVWIDPKQCREFGEALIKAADMADALDR